MSLDLRSSPVQQNIVVRNDSSSSKVTRLINTVTKKLYMYHKILIIIITEKYLIKNVIHRWFFTPEPKVCRYTRHWHQNTQHHTLYTLYVELPFLTVLENSAEKSEQGSGWIFQGKQIILLNWIQRVSDSIVISQLPGHELQNTVTLSYEEAMTQDISLLLLHTTCLWSKETKATCCH